MDEEPPVTAGPADAAAAPCAPRRHERLRTLLRFCFPGLWLIYLAAVVTSVVERTDGAATVVGIVLVALFAVCYLAALPFWSRWSDEWFRGCLAVLLAVVVIECLLVREKALVLLVYVAVLVISRRRPWSFGAAVACAAVAAFVPPLVPSWHTGVDADDGISIALVAVAMFGFFEIIAANRRLGVAQGEVARLAAENERSRIARDLHDLLGHSLTTITVKAGLARRLAETGDDEGARREIAEVEQLARRTLGDVRAAVAAHRELTLVNELATAGGVLRAAGVSAELPPSVAEVEPDVDELFAWVVREGVTNVVRHARAEHVRITLGRRSVEIADDGRGGGPDAAGNGLRGLRERAEALGGTLTVTSGFTGYAVRVDVPPRAAADAAVPRPLPEAAPR